MADAITPMDLDRRRGWARARASVTALVGIVVVGVSAGCFVMVVLAAVARFWTWIRGRDIDQTDLWGMAPAAAVAVGVLAVVVCTAIVFRWFWNGRVDLLLSDMSATAVAADDTRLRTVRNVTEELSIGLGRPVPELFSVDETIPNALSLRTNARRILCVTSGAADLPRDECEALVAHELGHLWAHDAHWVTSGMIGLSRARRAGTTVAIVGSVLTFMTVAIAWGGGRFLWSTFLFGVVLTFVGVASGSMLRRLELGMRRHADEIADVTAIRLAKNPASLAALCARLAGDDRTMTGLSWRSELLWFETPWLLDQMTGELEETDRIRARRELILRAERAYSEARVPVPEPHATAFAEWLAANPDDTPSLHRRPPPNPAPQQGQRKAKPHLTREQKRQQKQKRQQRQQLRDQRQSGEPPPGRKLP